MRQVHAAPATLAPLFLGVIVVLGLATPGVATAETRIATLVRGVGAGSDKAAGFVAHFVRAEFEADERYAVINLAETLGSPNADRATDAFETADSLLIKGREAFESLDLDPAVEHLNTALSKYERHAASVTDFKRVADGLMLLGASHILRGEEKTGAKRLAQAIALYPDVEPDPRIFNPGMREVFDKARKNLARRPAGDLSLSSTPSYAQIYIDGRFRGVTPTLVPEITEGGHYVRLVKDSYRDWGKMLNVRGSAETAETAELKSTTNFADYDGLVEQALAGLGDAEPSPAMVDALDQLGVMLNVDHLFIGEVQLDGELVKVTAHLYDLNRQKLIKRADQAFPYASETEPYAKEIGAFFAEEFSREALGPQPGDPDYDAEQHGGLGHAASAMCGGMKCTTYKMVVAGSVIGTGAVMMGVGGALWGAASGVHSDFTGGDVEGVPQQTDEFESLKSSGQVLAGVGDGLFFAGAAVLVVGTILILVWEPAPSAADVVSESQGLSLGIAPFHDGVAASARFSF